MDDQGETERGERRFEEYKAGREEESQWAKLNAPRMVNKGVVISTWETQGLSILGRGIQYLEV